MTRTLTRTTLPLLVIAALAFSAAAEAQAPGDMAAMVEEANRKLDEWIEKTNDFVGDVRFDEGDLQSFIEHFADFSELGDEMEDEEEFVDYDEVLADPRYRSWAKANGLAAEPWLKKSMRIMAITMRDQMKTGLAQAEAQMPEQLRMIEEQCAQMGAEMCAQMKASVDMSVKMFEHQKIRIGDLPQGTAEERALLERSADDIAALMGSGRETRNEDDDWEDE